jgi:hypothetical protein
MLTSSVFLESSIPNIPSITVFGTSPSRRLSLRGGQGAHQRDRRHAGIKD